MSVFVSTSASRPPISSPRNGFLPRIAPSPYIGTHGWLSKIVCPLVVQGQFRGALCIHQTDRLRRWTKDEVLLVESVAAQLVTGIAQAELFEMVERAKRTWETTFDAMSDGVFVFANDRSLTKKEIDVIAAWVDGGSKEGNPADLPPPVQRAQQQQTRHVGAGDGEEQAGHADEPDDDGALRDASAVAAEGSREAAERDVRLDTLARLRRKS